MENKPQPSSRRALAERRLRDRMAESYRRRMVAVEGRHFALLALLLLAAAALLALSLDGTASAQPYGSYGVAVETVNRIISLT